MTSEFLQGPDCAPQPTDEEPDGRAPVSPQALRRAGRLIDELLELVAQAREQAAQLERERDLLQRRLDRAAAPAASPEPPVPESPVADERRVGRGELRRALAPVLAAPSRRPAPLMALLGGDGG